MLDESFVNKQDKLEKFKILRNYIINNNIETVYWSGEEKNKNIDIGLSIFGNKKWTTRNKERINNYIKKLIEKLQNQYTVTTELLL